MPDTVTVTVKYPGEANPRDLELPTSVSVSTLALLVVRALGWPGAEEPSLAYAFRVEQAGIIVGPEQTLAAAGVLTGDILLLEKRSDRTPMLVSGSGRAFPVDKATLSIGRAHGRTWPDVDLSELEADRKHPISSRRHAAILVEGGNGILQPEDTPNGTFVNTAEIHPGERRSLKDGDVIQFGVNGVELTFCMPKGAA